MKKIIFVIFITLFLIMIWKFLPKFFPQKRNQLPYQKTFDFKNRKISYEKIGEGKPVILIHGSLSANPWGGWEKSLAKNYTVFIPHLPGYGASDSLPELNNVDLFSDAICELIKQNNLQDSPMIGYSYGTVVALETAAKNCTSGKLILVGVPAKLSGWKYELTRIIPLFIKRYLASTQFGKEKFIAPIVKDNIGNSGKVSVELLQAISQNDPRVSADVDIRAEVEIGVPKNITNIKNEKIFIYGENDALRNSTKEIIPDPIIIKNSGHNIFVGQPEESLELIFQSLH